MRLYILLILVLSLVIANAAYPEASCDVACENALQACQNLVIQEDTQAEHLKQQVTLLEKSLKEESSPLIPYWAWAIIGSVAGGFTVYEFKK
jgi:hypothetical protein